MLNIFQLILSRAKAARLFWGCFLLLVILFTRWPWIDCDGGVPSLNEYGYFVTDEGFYTGGAKEKLLSGHFIDVSRGETFTFTICPAMHLLTYASFLLFGQTSWAPRVFPFAINTVAWLMMFWALSRRTLPWIGCVLCSGILMTPFVMVYERTASSDVLMASVMMIGGCLTLRKGLVFTILGGIIFGFGFLVKKSIIVLFGLGLGVALMKHPRKYRWLHGLAMGIAFLATAFITKLAVYWSMATDAATQNVAISRLLELSKGSYALPNPLDLQNTFKGFSSFPRMPTDTRLGVLVVLFFLLPSLLFLRQLSQSPLRWNGKMLFYLSFPLYTCGILIMNTYYAHYLIPLIVFIPFLWLEARKDLRSLPDRLLWAKLGLFGLALALIVYVASFSVAAKQDLPQLAQYISQSYNMPQKILWLQNGWPILAAATLLAGCLLLARFKKIQIFPALCIIASALLTANLCFILYPMVQAAPYAPQLKPSQSVALLLQITSGLILFCVWQAPNVLVSGKRFLVLFFGILLFGVLQNPSWRTSATELQKRNHLQKQAVQDLRKLLPDNAVVTGERGPQLLVTLSAKALPYYIASNIPMLQALQKKDPTTSFYCIIDTQQSYVFQDYKKNPDKISMEIIHKMQLPSFGSNEPIDVYLAKLTLKQEGPRALP